MKRNGKIFRLFTLLLLIQSVVFCQVEFKYDIDEFNNLSYIDSENNKIDSLQQLNLVVPKEKFHSPLLIWIGGGAWSYVDKDQEMDFARRLGENGISVASVGHRLSSAVWKDSTLTSGVEHPSHVEDVAAAVAWLVKHAQKYGYDKKRIFIGGYSSGAHLAALISLDETYLLKFGLKTDLFKGVLPISGTFDIDHYYKIIKEGSRPELAELHVEAVFGSYRDQFKFASPTHYIHQLSAPILLMCDNNLYAYTRHFEEKIRATSFRDVQVVYAYKYSHAELWKNLSFEKRSIYRNMIIDFINSKL